MLDPSTAGTYNVEAVQNDDSKAWKSKVTYAGAGSQAAVGQLKLAPVGRISGRVRSAVSTVSDFSNTQVYIPGSSYIAITKADGSYTISNVPAGSFELGAFNVDLGDGALPDAEFTQPIRVLPSEVTEVPAIVLMTRPPEVSRLTRANSLELTDNGAPGQEIDLHGKNFGFNRGTRFLVQFSGGVLEAQNRLSEEQIRVKVPKDAENGFITVIVGGLPSGKSDFRIMKGFQVGISSLTLKAGETYDLNRDVEAQDGEGSRIVEVVDGDRVLKAKPNIAWTVDHPNLGIVLDKGEFKALSEGMLTLTAAAGELPQVKVTVTITPGTPGQSTTPSPSATSGATPTPVPSGSPVTGGAALLAVNPAIANTGQTLYLEGRFGPTATVNFPGGTLVAATVLGPNRAKVTVPATATAGNLTVTSDGETTRPLQFRKATFGLGLQTFAKHYDQASYGRSAPVLNTARAGHCLAAVGEHLYAIGGWNGSTLSTIERALINSDGSLGRFSILTDRSLVTARSVGACVTIGSSLYVIGGHDASGKGLKTLERAAISADGTLGAFQTVAGVELVSARYNFGSAFIGNYVYVVGGDSDTGILRSMERARIASDGSLEPFAAVAGSLKNVRNHFAMAVLGKFLYAFGGWNGSDFLDTIERAPIGADATVGPFEDVAGVTIGTARHALAASVVGDAVYMVGGGPSSSSPFTSVDRATFDADGNLGAFVAAPPLKTGRHYHPVTVVGNNLYVVGGMTPQGAPIAGVEWASLNSTGALGNFGTAGVPSLTVGRASHCNAVIGNYLYVVGGGNGSGQLTSVERASVKPDGSLGAFSAVGVPALSVARGAPCAVIGDYLYVFGGYDPSPGPLTNVERAAINVDGSLGQFTSEGVPALGGGHYLHTVAVIGSKLYVFGGNGSSCCDGRYASAEQAEIGADGTLGAFGVGPSLKTPRSYHNNVVIGDSVYMIFGDLTGSGLTNSIDGATINADGSLGGFSQAGTAAPVTAIPASTIVGNYLYVLGGWRGAGSRVEAGVRASIDANGAIGEFTATGVPKLALQRAYQSGVILGNYAYQIGGDPGGDYVTSIERATLD